MTGAIREVPDLQKARVRDVVELLARLLAEAENGEITAVACVLVHPGGEYTRVWRGGTGPEYLIGCVAQLQYAIQAHIARLGA